MIPKQYGVFVDVAPSDEEFNLSTEDDNSADAQDDIVAAAAATGSMLLKTDGQVEEKGQDDPEQQQQQQQQPPGGIEVSIGENSDEPTKPTTTMPSWDVPLLSEVTAGGSHDNHFHYGDYHTSIALPREVEASIMTNRTEKTQVKSQDVIKIFTNNSASENNDGSDCAEVTQEQLDRIKLMHRKMAEGALFSFNYNTLILVASIIAGCGLVGNSVATIIASMLVSPLMGPVVGLAYGASIRDYRLMAESLKTEIISLAFCIIVGMVVGGIAGTTSLADSWPTTEMAGRGTWENLILGLPIAFFSGFGVAVSLLDDQTSSLVGVAISASLLPPAVNAGILWVAYGFAKKNQIGSTTTTEPSCTCVVESGQDILKLDGATSYISEDDDSGYETHADYRKAGMISLLLTISNIVLIIISSMLMFRIKEVLPVKKKIFWTDLGTARKVYQRKAIIKRYHTTMSGNAISTTETIGINSSVESNRPEN